MKSDNDRAGDGQRSEWNGEELLKCFGGNLKHAHLSHSSNITSMKNIDRKVWNKNVDSTLQIRSKNREKHDKLGLV